MADLKRVEIENALKSHLGDIDRLFLRRVQKMMFECAAKCCSNTTGSTQDVQYCIDKCNDMLVGPHKYVASEVQNYQDRLYRCVSDCNDVVKDQLGVSPSEAQIEAATKIFDDCACQCVDKNLDILPQFMAKIHEVMKKKVADLASSSDAKSTL